MLSACLGLISPSDQLEKRILPFLVYGLSNGATAEKNHMSHLPETQDGGR
jgi:hypothetical protein